MDAAIMGRCCVYQLRLQDSLDIISKVVPMVKILNIPIEEEKRCNVLNAISAKNRRIMASAYKACLRKCEHLKVLAINVPDCDATTFINGRVWAGYHLGISFSYNGNMWYKIWRMGLEPDKHISCRKIAEAYGGHGSDTYGEFKTTGQLEVLPIK
jgi:hypothetical protein